MAKDVVDIAHVNIRSSQGSRRLDSVTSITVNRRDPKTPVKTMNPRRRAIGYTRGVPDFDLDVETAVLMVPEVDWDALMQSGEIFGITYERGDNGKRFSCIDCTVSEVSEPYRESGETRQTVRVVALDHKEE